MKINEIFLVNNSHEVPLLLQMKSWNRFRLYYYQFKITYILFVVFSDVDFMAPCVYKYFKPLNDDFIYTLISGG